MEFLEDSESLEIHENISPKAHSKVLRAMAVLEAAFLRITEEEKLTFTRRPFDQFFLNEQEIFSKEAHTLNNTVDAGFAQPIPAPAAPAPVAMQATVSGSKDAVQEAREKEPKNVAKPLIPTILESAELLRRRKDDDTLREVGNTMPEYDCDKDDPPKFVIEKTQDSIDTKTARVPSGRDKVLQGNLEKQHL